MRMLRLDVGAGEPIDLHPFVTVMTGLPPAERGAVIEAFGALVSAAVDGHAGSLEAHGVVLDVDQSTLALLDLDGLDVDPVVVVDDLRAATGAVDVAPDEGGATRADAHPGTAVDDEVDRRIDQLRAVLALQGSFDADADAIAAALDDLRLRSPTDELVPSATAREMADRLVELAQRAEQLAADGTSAPTAEELEVARSTLADARAALADAERQPRPSSLDADIAELDAAHLEVLEASEALEARFAGARARQRHEEAVAREQAALERLGIRTYLDFVTGGRSALLADAEPTELRELRSAERRAAHELAALEKRTKRAVEVAAVEHEIAELRERARLELDAPHLDGGELVRALYELRVPAGSTPLQRLIAALEGVGLAVGSADLPADDVEAIAVDWLDEQRRFQERRQATEAELATLEALVDGTQPAADDAAPAGSGAGAVGTSLRMTPRDVALAPAEEIEWYVLSRLAAQRQVGSAGSVPLLVDGALDGVDDDDGLVRVLDRLERMAGAVQVVHVTEDARILRWAESIGVERAGVVRRGAGVGGDHDGR